MKYLLTEEHALRIESELSRWLVLDPHSEDIEGYRTTTVYCDTPAFDVFHRTRPHARRKYRLRRYGDSETVFVERKSKRGTRVRKFRTQLAASDLTRLSHEHSCGARDCEWFRQTIRQYRLAPVVAVTYARRAWLGTWSGEPVRVTFDRDIRGGSHRIWSAEPPSRSQGVLADRVVCELKFHGMVPGPFVELARTFRLIPATASKYRLCAIASGVVTGRRLRMPEWLTADAAAGVPLAPFTIAVRLVLAAVAGLVVALLRAPRTVDTSRTAAPCSRPWCC